MRKKYILDAYNIIHKLYPKHTKTLEELRSAFEQTMEIRANAMKTKFVIVYDGNRTTSSSRSALEIHFSKKGQTADDYIKQMIDASNKYQLIVVSSDNSVKDYAKVSRVETMSSEDFIMIVHPSKKKQLIEKPTRSSKEEEIEFKRLFEESQNNA